MDKTTNPIGIFDSGMGGLSVLSEIQKLLPNESIIFYGDNLNCPYGPKSKEEIIYLSEKNTEFLLHQSCKVIVVACNTATGAAIYHLRNKYKVPFIGIEPAVKPAAEKSKTKVIGVLATEGTFNGDHFKKTSEKFADDTIIVTVVGHYLVEMVESGKIDSSRTKKILKECLRPILAQNADQLVLGCTHYPFLIPTIKKLVPSTLNIINPAPAVASRTSEILKSENLLNVNNVLNPSYKFYTSGNLTSLRTFVESNIACSKFICDFKKTIL